MMLALVAALPLDLSWLGLGLLALALLPLEVLIRPLTRDEVKAKLYEMLATAGFPVTSWQEAAAARTIVAVLAAVLAGFTSVIAVVIRGTLLDLAEGVWLTLLAKFVYGVDRHEATFATGPFDLENTEGGVFNNVQPGELIVRDPSTGKTFTNTEEFSLGAEGSPEAEITVTIRATETGASSSAGAGAITEFVTQFAGVIGSNPDPLVGTDEELDRDLRVRCRDSLGALSPNGPVNAYAFFAKNVRRAADGTLIPVNRVKVFGVSPNSHVRVVVASPSGDVEPSDVAEILAALAPIALACGRTLEVFSAVETTINFVGELWVDGAVTLSDPEIEAAVDAKLTAYLASVPIGGLQKVSGQGKVWKDALNGQIFQAVDGMIEVDLSSPASDTTIVAGLPGAAVPKIGSTIWTIHRVEQA